ncbi:ammonium transporter [Flammeovirgaceae bacterium 311]|nr:ammonium transporter [Flammeovirgaceae bacterium 311]
MTAEKKRKLGLYVFLLLLAIGFVASIYPAHHPEAEVANSGDVAWVIFSSALVLLMTPGLSFFYGGMVRPKNIISTMLQSFVALGVISVLWYVVGFSLAFGESIGGIIGNPMTYFMFDNVGTAPHPVIASGIPFVLFAAFQLKFAIITPALITGSFAERVRFWSYLLFICLFSLLIYCPLAHWTWHPDGFLFKWGVLDFAGGTVVHISAGFAALAGAWLLGRRKSHLSNEEYSPVNIPYVILGTGLLWFGWFGFNAGSALAASSLAVTAFVNTNLASASAMIAWMLMDTVRGKKPSALGACIGAVVGLVAITPAAGFVGFGPSLFIGIMASIISNCAVHWKTKSTLDDTLDVFPCHGVGGIVGMIATSIFAKEGGLITGETTLFLYHMLALVIVFVFTFGGSVLLYKFTNWVIPMRVKEDQEDLGLDLSQHYETVTEGHFDKVSYQ